MHSEQGESACYLDLVGSDGTLLEPRHRVFLVETQMRGESDSSWIIVSTQPGDPRADLVLPELAPLPRESVEGYRTRLAEPLCLTSLWRVVLMSESRPVGISRSGGKSDDGMATVLIEYVWGLMG